MFKHVVQDVIDFFRPTAIVLQVSWCRCFQSFSPSYVTDISVITISSTMCIVNLLYSGDSIDGVARQFWKSLDFVNCALLCYCITGWAHSRSVHFWSSVQLYGTF